MMNVCARCGLYRVDKEVTGIAPRADRSKLGGQSTTGSEPASAVAICPHCNHPHPFQRLPLLIVGGASGTGKTAILQRLTGLFRSAVLLEADLLWLKEFEAPQDGSRRFYETWLRLAKNIGQSGRPVVLFGAGFAVADNVEPCVERRYFGRLHYLTLVCADEDLRRRLQARPEWRRSGLPEPLQEQLDFNRWLREEGPQQNPRPTLLDTTDRPVEESATEVGAWIEQRASLDPPRAGL